MALCVCNNCSCVICGVNTSCVNQVPPSEVVIQPPPVTVTIPGPILSASCDPVAVAQHTPCAIGYGGLGGYGSGYGRRCRYCSLYPYCYPGYSQRYSYGACGPC